MQQATENAIAKAAEDASRLLTELTELVKVGREFLQKAIDEDGKKQAERAARSGR